MAPHWTDAPPKDDLGQPWPIRRTPADKPICGFAINPTLLGCDTHFYRGRTTPCERPDCPACDEGRPYRWHAWIPTHDPATQTSWLFECTAAACDAFQAYLEHHGTLRGCCYKAYRPSGAPNGRIIIATKPGDLQRWPLPPEIDLLPMLARIWNRALDTIQPGAQSRQRISLAVQPDEKGNGQPPDPELVRRIGPTHSR